MMFTVNMYMIFDIDVCFKRIINSRYIYIIYVIFIWKTVPLGWDPSSSILYTLNDWFLLDISPANLPDPRAPCGANQFMQAVLASCTTLQ